MGFIQLGPDTVFDGVQVQTVAPSAANMFGSIAPLTQLGPAPEPTLPPGNTVAGWSGPSVSSSPTNPIAVQQSANPMSSHSAIVWAIAAIVVSLAGLHWIFYAKEKVM